MDIRIDGLSRLNKELENVAKTQRTKGQIEKACALVEGAAKEYAPKGAGDLRRSIEYLVQENPGEVVGVVYTPLFYAPYVEFGTGIFAETYGRQDVPWVYKDDDGEWHTTSGIEPTPFMYPALVNNKQQVLQLIKEGLRG